MVTRESEKCKNLARRGKWRRPALPILLCKSKELPAAFIPQLLDYLSEEILPWQKVSKNMFILIFLKDMENDSQVFFLLLSMNNTNLLNWYILLLRLSRKVSFILEVDVSFDKTVCLRKICDPSYHVESLSSRRDSKENPPGYRQKPPSVKKLTAAPMKSSSQRVDLDSRCYVGLGRLYYPLSLIEHLT